MSDRQPGRFYHDDRAMAGKVLKVLGIGWVLVILSMWVMGL